jgi:hypothetical protein
MTSVPCSLFPVPSRPNYHFYITSSVDPENFADFSPNFGEIQDKPRQDWLTDRPRRIREAFYPPE